ncbi:hypothetical protein [Methanobacterium oryzae]|uniref:hypothetical protein n=1 Tax=Methanobacterium oryzae TaxID=69540 RepID=UPI003D1E5400
MSCYIRYMKEFLNGINIDPETKEDRKEIDENIRGIIGKSSSDKCNEIWREVKVWLQDPDKKQELEEKLKESI